jgi:hypothetical protein
MEHAPAGMMTRQLRSLAAAFFCLGDRMRLAVKQRNRFEQGRGAIVRTLEVIEVGLLPQDACKGLTSYQAGLEAN